MESGPKRQSGAAALEAYSFWIAQGVPVGAKWNGAGYPKDFKPPEHPIWHADHRCTRRIARCAMVMTGRPKGCRPSGVPAAEGCVFTQLGRGYASARQRCRFYPGQHALGAGWLSGSSGGLGYGDVHGLRRALAGPTLYREVADTRREFHDDPTSLYGIEINGAVVGANPAR